LKKRPNRKFRSGRIPPWSLRTVEPIEDSLGILAIPVIQMDRERNDEILRVRCAWTTHGQILVGKTLLLIFLVLTLLNKKPSGTLVGYLRPSAEEQIVKEADVRSFFETLQRLRDNVVLISNRQCFPLVVCVLYLTKNR
jgi:hypothetical protein